MSNENFKDFIEASFTNLRALIKQNVELVNMVVDNKMQQKKETEEEIEKKIEAINKENKELKERIDELLHNPIIKILVKNPLKSLVVLILIILIMSGVLSIGSILELLTQLS